MDRKISFKNRFFQFATKRVRSNKISLKPIQLQEGPEGQDGNPGVRGSMWYEGSGAPSGISSPMMGDHYLDTTSGNVYSYSTTWNLAGNIKGIAGSTGVTGSAGSSGAKGDKGDAGNAGTQGIQGTAGTPKRFDKYTGNLTTGGALTLTFGTPYASTPVWFEDTVWSGSQAFFSYATAISTISVTIKCKRSRGTLLLASGPFEDAVSGEPFSIMVAGN